MLVSVSLPCWLCVALLVGCIDPPCRFYVSVATLPCPSCVPSVSVRSSHRTDARMMRTVQRLRLLQLDFGGLTKATPRGHGKDAKRAWRGQEEDIKGACAQHRQRQRAAPGNSVQKTRSRHFLHGLANGERGRVNK